MKVTVMKIPVYKGHDFYNKKSQIYLHQDHGLLASNWSPSSTLYTVLTQAEEI